MEVHSATMRAAAGTSSPPFPLKFSLFHNLPLLPSLFLPVVACRLVAGTVLRRSGADGRRSGASRVVGACPSQIGLGGVRAWAAGGARLPRLPAVAHGWGPVAAASAAWWPVGRGCGGSRGCALLGRSKGTATT